LHVNLPVRRVEFAKFKRCRETPNDAKLFYLCRVKNNPPRGAWQAARRRCRHPLPSSILSPPDGHGGHRRIDLKDIAGTVMQRSSHFTRFATWTAGAAGRPMTFVLACLIIVVWGITGPLFGYSDTWQLVINTSTTIVTFLMVFLIQNTQNRDSKAVQLKLDELLRSTQGAHNALLDLEELNEDELNRIRRLYAALAAKARMDMDTGLLDVDIPDIDIRDSGHDSGGRKAR
jgi:low affinity Fe/Cu permease